MVLASKIMSLYERLLLDSIVLPPEDEGSTFLRNVLKFLPDYMYNFCIIECTPIVLYVVYSWSILLPFDRKP
jgi:hypothetical protein